MRILDQQISLAARRLGSGFAHPFRLRRNYDNVKKNVAPSPYTDFTQIRP
jgi:hypothetical protein